VKSIIDHAAKSQDPAIRLQASQYKAWAEAGNALDAAKLAVEDERRRFKSERPSLEATIALKLKHAEPVVANASAAIARSQGEIDMVNRVVEEARSALARAVAEHKTKMDGLESAVKAAEQAEAHALAAL
jgi:uncharacterized lipoprotein